MHIRLQRNLSPRKKTLAILVGANNRRTRLLTASPGATSSGFTLPSNDGPVELKNATVSISELPLAERRVLPDVEAPTARTFFAMAGLFIVHVSRTTSPMFPAENMSKLCGFCGDKYADGRRHKEMRGFVWC